ncbi:adenine deaminase [Spirochaetia bacterium]|nr:adenine deaminase [Spirochaetia bacterium]
MDKDTLKKLIGVAAGRIPADLVIRNGIIADVYSGRFIEGDLAVSGPYIAAITEPGSSDGLEIIDAQGQYILPGFIDGHIHIESSFLSPGELGRLLLPLGTCTIIADPHEIVNVCGAAGLEYMMTAAFDTVMDIKFMAPSCVPATPFEHSGAVLDARALAAPLRNENILGLGEFMDYNAVIAGEDAALEKILLAKSRDRLIDGHSPGLGARELNAYAAASIHTDHECTTPEEMEQRLSRGMYVMLRQGSACHDLKNLLPAVTEQNSRRCILCSDDYQPKTIFEQGHINNDIKICVEAGIAPMTAIRMATLNTAECFRLSDRGGLAPGLRADMVLVEDLKNFRANSVFVQGKLAASKGSYLPVFRSSDDRSVRGSFHVRDFSAKKLALHLKSDDVWVIDIRPGSVVTGKGQAQAARNSSGDFICDPSRGIAKIAVVERHRGTGNVGVGFIRGYGIKRGAIAISVAHDSHNIIVVGVNDTDMTLAVERLINIGGGVVLLRDGKTLEEMPLPLGGTMSDQSGEWVNRKLEALQQTAFDELDVSKDVEPLMTLCFMSLPVIPELKITDMGLFDVKAFKFIKTEREKGE